MFINKIYDYINMTLQILSQEKFFTYLFKYKDQLSHFILKIEKRDPRWMYGIHNHAEFIGFMNPHDNCLWDALIPGYKEKCVPDKKYKLKNIIGIYLLENGNHKIVCKIYKPGYNSKKAIRDVHTYMKKYYTKHTLDHKWVQLSEF